ncbi:hypothetical protein B0H19DRAFT_1251928 [Mycena capillaripes]|nr:hypothetical protein B0H19DRAFT_1251928 [Mycena capillaripes]
MSYDVPSLHSPLQMEDISGASLSIVASELPPTPKTVFTIFAISGAAAFIHYTSPMRLTRVLVGAMAVTEETYLEALETGLLSASDVHAIGTLLSILQLKVSEIREESLDNSRSNWKACSGFFKGRSLTILRCIWEVRDLETHIEVL